MTAHGSPRCDGRVAGSQCGAVRGPAGNGPAWSWCPRLPCPRGCRRGQSRRRQPRCARRLCSREHLRAESRSLPAAAAPCSVFSELAELAEPAVPAVGRRLAEAERLLVSPAARRSSWRVCSRAAAGPFLTNSQLCAHVLLTGLLLAASARGPRRSPSRPCWSRPRLARTRQGARPGGRALSVRHLFFLVTNVPALSQLRLSVCPTGSIPVPAWGPHQAFFPLELAWCVSRHRFLFKFKVGPSSTT